MEFNENLIDEFITFSQNKWRVQSTLQRFRREITRYYRHLKQNKWGSPVYVDDITIKSIESFKNSIMDDRIPKNSRYYWKEERLSTKTIQSKVQVVKNFLHFVNYVYWVGINANIVEIPKAKSKRMDYFTLDEIHTILDYIESSEKNELNKVRLQLVVLIWFTSWLRLSEILNLKKSELLQSVHHLKGKWWTWRYVFFCEQIHDLFYKYLNLRKKPTKQTGKTYQEKSDYAIISHSARNYWWKFQKSSLCEIFKRISRWLNLGKELSTHTLRHSFATYLLSKWIDISKIQHLLWHAKLETTATYLHENWENLKIIQNNVFWFEIL